MQWVVIGLAIAAAVLSRPIVARLWRAGRISDRTAAILLLGRFPMMVLLFGLILRAPMWMVLGLIALATIPPVLFFGFTLDLLREQRRTGES